jgi:hypothetical protein
MTENPPAEPTRQAIAVRGRSAPGKVTGKLKAAISWMVWGGLPRDEAAAKAGLTPHGLYSALRKNHVKAEYLAECEVLRVSGRARRIHRLEALSEQDENKMAAVQASRALDAMGNDAAATAGTGLRAGLLIVVVDGQGKPLPMQPVQTPPRVIENDPINTPELEDGDR